MDNPERLDRLPRGAMIESLPATEPSGEPLDCG
jgi:hypothetical protein